MIRVVLVALGVALWSSPARAEATFEGLAAAAQPLRHVDDLVWLATETCDRGDEVQQRQCRLVRDRRAKQLTGATLLVEADPDALEIGRWNPAKKSVSLVLHGCVRCG